MVRALKTFGYERAGGRVSLFHCPMAIDEEGAMWLQEDEEVRNPYHGSAMLRCGSRVEVLAQES